VNISPFVAGTLIEFKTNGRIVIVGASLAGLRAAETLRHEGFNGKLTIIGDEKHEPYDRPPLGLPCPAVRTHGSLRRHRRTAAEGASLRVLFHQ
jgi:2-polyprenyl-6-methoxyphenol hydroxylase-like FAD-dependent oxidoreductase